MREAVTQLARMLVDRDGRGNQATAAPSRLDGAEVKTAAREYLTAQETNDRPRPKMPSEMRREYADDDPGTMGAGVGPIGGRA